MLGNILMAPGNRLKPSLFVCGHFHGNVRFTGEAYGAPLEVVVSSAIGAQMRWDGIAGDFTPAQAAEVGSEPTGGAAFFAHILDKDPKNAPTLIPERLQAHPKRSGGRVFEFSDAGYRHRWLTLDKIPEGVTEISDLFELPGPGPTDAVELVEWATADPVPTGDRDALDEN